MLHDAIVIHEIVRLSGPVFQADDNPGRVGMFNPHHSFQKVALLVLKDKGCSQGGASLGKDAGPAGFLPVGSAVQGNSGGKRFDPFSDAKTQAVFP